MVVPGYGLWNVRRPFWSNRYDHFPGRGILSMAGRKRQRREAERLSEHKSDIMTGFLHGILAGNWPDIFVLQANDILARIDPH
jgi:hypothetical protein